MLNIQEHIIKEITEMQFGRGIAIWGAKTAGHEVLYLLRKNKIIPECFIDKSAERPFNHDKSGLLVMPPERLKSDWFVIIASYNYEAEIVADLKSQGFKERDYFCYCTRVDELFKEKPHDMMPQLPYNASNYTMSANLKSLEGLVGDEGTIIDIGASNGLWTNIAKECFPKSNYFLVEANIEHEPELKKFTQNVGCQYIIAAAGNNMGNINILFRPGELYGGMASHNPFTENNYVVPMVTIDWCVEKYKLESPYILKFDTHGFEVQIIEGAEKTLQQTKAIIMEMYLYKFSSDVLLFPDMCKYLEQKGFRCVGFAEPWEKPATGLWFSMDLVFIRQDHVIFYGDL